MKRGYTIEDYREMFARIRQTLPAAAVSSDFIVGSVANPKNRTRKKALGDSRMPLQNSFIFKYSPRRDQGMNGWTTTSLKRMKRQKSEMLTLQNQISAEE